jgi:putative salt-induced outer membrane protein YdiY
MLTIFRIRRAISYHAHVLNAPLMPVALPCSGIGTTTSHSNKENCMKSLATQISIAVCATLTAGAVQAQTTLKPDGNWRGSLGMGLSVTDGNSKSTSFNLNGETIRLTERDKARIYGTALYGKNNGTESTNLQRFGGRYDYNLTPVIFGFGGLDFERDKINNLELRIAPSAGVGAHVIKSATTTFDVFGGVSYVMDKFFNRTFVDGSNRTSYNRPELLLGESSTHKLTETTSFRQSLTIYPNLSNRGEYRAVFDAGLSVAMSSTMSLTVGVIDRYNSDPGTKPGVVPTTEFKKNDVLFVTGVAVKFD